MYTQLLRGGNNGDALHMVFASLMSDEWTFVPTAAPTWHRHDNHVTTRKPAIVHTEATANKQNRKFAAINNRSNGSNSSKSSMASVRKAGQSKHYWRQGKASHKNSIYTGEE